MKLDRLALKTQRGAGQRVAYGIRRGDFGEIWVVSLDGGQHYPIAGPTGPEAAFAWVK